MAQLFDSSGNPCGHIGDDQAVPSGYWTLPDSFSCQTDPLTFIDTVGAANFGAIWSVMVTNPPTTTSLGLAFSVMRGFAAQAILMSESFPETLAMEAAGLLPAGSSIGLWQAIAAAS